MATNPRIYYPLHAVGFSRLGGSLGGISGQPGTGNYLAAKGVQSVSYSTNFNLEQVFQLGQLEQYENIENRPDVEITIEKVLDGKALLEHLATQTATTSSLGGRYDTNRCQVIIAYYNNNLDHATGTPLSILEFSGCYVSAINWNLPIEGNFTESVTLVGNNKRVFRSPSGIPWNVSTRFNGNEGPIGGVSGGVNRRENLDMSKSIWPTGLPGINGAGVNLDLGAGSGYSSHIQSISIATTLARTDLLEQGRKNPYFRYAEFPTEVTCSIEMTASELGDNIEALENQDNLFDEEIILHLDCGVIIDLGSRNKLASINVAGGDTGGGNATVTYNYSNFNSLTIVSSGDPAGLTS